MAAAQKYVAAHRLAVAGSIVAAGLVAVYAFLAIVPQPLQPSEQGLAMPGGQTILTDPKLQDLPGDEFGPPVTVLTYVDRQVDIVVESIYNGGSMPVTLTGMETTNHLDYWQGLITIQKPRAAVVIGPAPCCEIDVEKTFQANEFRPLEIAPGKWGVIAFQILMNNCESNGPGGYVGVDPINVRYTILGFPHTQAVSIGPYWIESPPSCPRSGAAR